MYNHPGKALSIILLTIGFFYMKDSELGALGGLIYLTVFSQRAEVFNFDDSPLNIFFIMLLVLYLRNYCITQGRKDFLLMFSSAGFIVLLFAFMSMIHFELVFANDVEVWIKIHIFVYGSPIVPASFVKKTIISPMNSLCTFVNSQLATYV